MSSLSDGFCTICLGKIAPQETALVKGCKHAYCVKCILKWATYHDTCTLCPQCKCPFEFLYVHRALDGRHVVGKMFYIFLLIKMFYIFLHNSIHDAILVEECVCLLVRANWFIKLKIESREEEDLDETDYIGSYVRAGWNEARLEDIDVGPSFGLKKELARNLNGKRAKVALKRETTDMAAAAKYLQRFKR